MMLSATLDQMARGGLFDQLAGGFHRYATDREWRVPHFEKMLYDNGLLLELYAREHARTGSPETRRVALETAAWLAREMGSPEGAFWSALDAETDGHEGAYFVWTKAELDAALGVEDAEFAAPLLGFADEPFFEREAYVLHLPRPLEVQARQRRTTYEALVAELDPLRARLLEARSRRKRPATDDKVLTDWNGTAIAGLAETGRCFDSPELVARAARAADFVVQRMRGADGVLLHAWRAGEGRIAAFLSDYVFLVRGLLRLHEASGERRWLDEAVRLEAEQARRLASPRGGYFNAQAADDLLIRSKELFDGAMPAANGVAALNLLDLHAATGEARYLAEAERTVRAFVPIVTTHPDGARTMCIALARLARAQEDGREGKASMKGKAKERTAPASPARGGEGASGSASTALGGASTGIDGGNSDAAPGGAEGSAPMASRPPSTFPSLEAFPSLSSVFLTLPKVELLPAGDAGDRDLRFRCELRDGWHLAVAEERTVPALGVEGGEIVDLVWPEPVDLIEQDGAEAVRALVGSIEARGRLRRDAPRVRLLFRFEACGEGRCLPIQEVELGEI